MKFLSIFLILFLSVFGSAQQTAVGTASPITVEMHTKANELYQKQEWLKASEAYAKIVKADDADITARYRYGVSLLALNKNEAAVPHLEKALNISPNPYYAHVLARAHFRVGNKEKAYEALEKIATLGGMVPAMFNDEKDFAAFKAEQRFVDLVKKSEIAANPCKANPEFRQFDFWIGEWEARNAQGVIVGSSSIQLVLGDCIIFENWSTPVSSGKSFNVYDTTDRRWHQTWVDDKGTFVHYIGDLKDGKMVYVADTIIAGKKTLAKMTFSKLENGDVRQLGENSADGGKTWTPAFDFTYIRKK
ncbi:MAG: hypothetical protein H7070_13715 [Saprospiraceae bacterium]|nr:hypothetical protein [Pyrinomonadaceae bacterium]